MTRKKLFKATVETTSTGPAYVYAYSLEEAEELFRREAFAVDYENETHEVVGDVSEVEDEDDEDFDDDDE